MGLGDKIQSGIESGVGKGTELVKGTVEAVLKGIFETPRPDEQPKPAGESEKYRKNNLVYYQYLIKINEHYIDGINRRLAKEKAELRRVEDAMTKSQTERKKLRDEVGELKDVLEGYDENDERYRSIEQQIQSKRQQGNSSDVLMIESDVFGDKKGKYSAAALRDNLEARTEADEELIDEYTDQRNLAEKWFDYYWSENAKRLAKEND